MQLPAPPRLPPTAPPAEIRSQSAASTAPAELAGAGVLTAPRLDLVAQATGAPRTPPPQRPSPSALQPLFPIVSYQSAPDRPVQVPFELGPGSLIGSYEFSSGPAPALRHQLRIDDRTIEIVVPVQRHARAHTAAEIADAVASLNPYSRATLRSITQNPGSNPHDRIWAQRFNDAGFYSYMSVLDGAVNIYPKRSAKATQGHLETALTHETGHTIGDHLLGPRLSGPVGQKWIAAMRADRTAVSGYASSALTEDFPETLAVYFRVKGTPVEAQARARTPARFALLEALLPEFERLVGERR